MAIQTKPFISEDDYLAYEREAKVKSEYYNGEVFAMSGGSRNHALLTANTNAVLHAALRGSDCRVFSSDLRIHIPASGLYTYPDLSVVCGAEEMLDEKQDVLLNPTLLVEVLSPSTESYDRGTKFGFYRSIATLREYVLVSQQRPLIEVFRKNDVGQWVLHEADDDQDIALASVGATLSLAAIYEGVTLDDPTLR